MSDEDLESDENREGSTGPLKHGLVINTGSSVQHWPFLLPDNDIHGDGQAAADTLRADETHSFLFSYPDCTFNTSQSTSMIEGLLIEIYDRGYHMTGANRDSMESDTTFTEYSSTCENIGGGRRGILYSVGAADSLAQKPSEKSQRSFMSNKSALELRAMIAELQHRVAQTSSRLVRLLKKKDKRLERQHNYCDIITASLQASSLKRRVDMRIKFSISPGPGKRGFRQWHDALRAMCRLPSGIPRNLRRKVWLCLADHYLKQLKVDWEKTVRYTFNDRSNPDDEKLGVQIVKDLHRTGYSGFSGEEAEADRLVLKRVLLAYARWNKHVGYCQGFNVLAALLLQVCDGHEGDTLKLMIYLVDRVLPQNYFSHNLRALSVDMAVFRDLLRVHQPALSAHFDRLQTLANAVPYAQSAAAAAAAAAAQPATGGGGGAYEPPLTNVFTMQWFLTLFATCLPKQTVLRVWDCIFLEGSEMLLRVALAIWTRISDRVMCVESADEFYCAMAKVTTEMFENNFIDTEILIESVYALGPIPFSNLAELREKYTYNITPFSPMHSNAGGKAAAAGAGKSRGGGGGQGSDDDDDEDRTAIRCFPAFGAYTSPVKNNFRGELTSSHAAEQSGSADILNASPGAYGCSDPSLPPSAPPPLERMSTDIHALKKQYSKLQHRMQQVHVIYYGGRREVDEKPVEVVNPMKTNLAINHLFVVNKEQTKTQLPAAVPHSEPHTAPPPPVNHLTIKPYIPLESSSRPASSISRSNQSTSSGSCERLSSKADTFTETDDESSQENLVSTPRSSKSPDRDAPSPSSSIDSSLAAALSSGPRRKDSRSPDLSPASTASSVSSKTTSSKLPNTSTVIKPNIRPNLGCNDRPRIYNPFPVRYVHNAKMKKGQRLGLYASGEKPAE